MCREYTEPDVDCHEVGQCLVCGRQLQAGDEYVEAGDWLLCRVCEVNEDAERDPEEHAPSPRATYLMGQPICSATPAHRDPEQPSAMEWLCGQLRAEVAERKLAAAKAAAEAEYESIRSRAQAARSHAVVLHARQHIAKQLQVIEPPPAKPTPKLEVCKPRKRRTINDVINHCSCPSEGRFVNEADRKGVSDAVVVARYLMQIRATAMFRSEAIEIIAADLGWALQRVVDAFHSSSRLHNVVVETGRTYIWLGDPLPDTHPARQLGRSKPLDFRATAR